MRAIDPKHPVLVSINFTKQQEYDGYFDERAFDILDLHKYPNPDVGPAQERLLSTFKQNRHRKYRVIVTLRAYEAPGKVRRQNMREGTLFQQYSFFFGPTGSARTSASTAGASPRISGSLRSTG
jgi:hypothetical protein